MRGVCSFFMGKNKLMCFALGREPSNEIKPNIYQLTQVSSFSLDFRFPPARAEVRCVGVVQRISGNSCGVFFTDAKPAEVLQYVTAPERASERVRGRSRNERV
jgi:hypothetical protein